MNTNVYVFWPYDLYPYVCGGVADKRDEARGYYVPAYQAWVRAPLAVLEVEEGEKIREKLRALEYHFHVARGALLAGFEEQAVAVAPWANHNNRNT